MQTLRTQVVVAGAGPVGTVAAYYLASQGVDVVLLEDGADCALDLRASTFHPPTLEMLEEFDITARLIEKGLKAPIYHFRERRTGDVIDFDLSEIADATPLEPDAACAMFREISLVEASCCSIALATVTAISDIWSTMPLA